MHTSEAENFVVLTDVANHPQTREIEMADLFSCNIKTEAVRRSVQNQKGLINTLSRQSYHIHPKQTVYWNWYIFFFDVLFPYSSCGYDVLTISINMNNNVVMICFLPCTEQWPLFFSLLQRAKVFHFLSLECQWCKCFKYVSENDQ
jgi:hypothetical protein